MCIQSANFHHNIIKALEQVHDSTSYKAIATHISDIITERTIATHLKPLNGYKPVKSHILHLLNEDSNRKNLDF